MPRQGLRRCDDDKDATMDAVGMDNAGMMESNSSRASESSSSAASDTIMWGAAASLAVLMV